MDRDHVFEKLVQISMMKGVRAHHLKSNLVDIVLGYGVVLYLLDVPIRHKHNFDVSTNTVYLVFWLRLHSAPVDVQVLELLLVIFLYSHLTPVFQLVWFG